MKTVPFLPLLLCEFSISVKKIQKYNPSTEYKRLYIYIYVYTKPEYGKALKDSGYKKVNLKYRAQKEQRKKNN